jgi:serine/threonine-protein kinase
MEIHINRTQKDIKSTKRMRIRLLDKTFSFILSSYLITVFLFLSLIYSSLMITFLLYFPEQQASAESVPIASSVNSSSSSSSLFSDRNHTNGNFFTYQNSSEGIKIEYPTNWKKVDHADNASIPSHTIEFLSPLTANDIFQENVFVRIDPFPQDLRELVVAEVNGFKTHAVNFMLLDSMPSVLASNPAQTLVFKYSNFLPKLNTLEAMVVLTVKNQKAYAISYVAESSKYPEYLSTVQRMIDSFRIIK